MVQRIAFIHRIRFALLVAGASGASCFGAEPATPALRFPKIETYGATADLPSAEERPRAGGKVVIDTTAAAPAGKPNRGLESAARLVNIYELEKMTPGRPKIAVILHSNATAAALTDVAHAKTTAGGVNPNRELVEKLLPTGWRCGCADSR